MTHIIYRGCLDSKLDLLFALNSTVVERVEFGCNVKKFMALLSDYDWEVASSNKTINEWLSCYKRGKPKKFPYRLNPKGTEFQKAVWKAMQKIPYGEVRSYKWIASKIGRPGAVRAVGTACGTNPIPLLIPCHRVVATDGLGGFSSGLKIKKKLLKLEGTII